jgi:uncharacterized protein YndB with AHSA1/START domain
MRTRTELPAGEPFIVMTRLYDAPRDVVWEAITKAEHVREWWGGPGCTNPICEMDVRPGGLWHHVMRFPDGKELVMDFVFLEVERPKRLVWQHADHGKRHDGPPASHMTVTLEDLGDTTKWMLVSRFDSLADREAAVAFGFTHPIEASSDRLVQYLKNLCQERGR